MTDKLTVVTTFVPHRNENDTIDGYIVDKTMDKSTDKNKRKDKVGLRLRNIRNVECS